jgi:poly-gamma-glutamate synthesis protein (capsule biosynthesis protein)
MKFFLIINRKLVFGVCIVLATFSSIAWFSADYKNTRIEGLSQWDSFLSGISYLRKYNQKKLTTTDSLAAYFRNQIIAQEYYQEIRPDSTILSIGAVGDLMWIKSDWDHFLSPEVKSVLETQDVVFGNLETPIDTCTDVPGFWPDYLTYNSAPGLVRSFYSEKKHKNIFSAFSIANNHCFDRKEAGLARTIQFLDKEGIKCAGIVHEGSSSKKYTLIEEKGIRIGFYAACWGVNDPEEMKKSKIKVNIIPGIAPLEPKKINTRALREVLLEMEDDSIDFKVLSLHWGYEYELYPDPEIMKLAHQLVIFGADLIIGSHPHMVQPNEICYVNNYSDPLLHHIETTGLLKSNHLTDGKSLPRKSLIMYSLGNFTTNMFTELCKTGAIQTIILRKNSETNKIDWYYRGIDYVYNQHNIPVPGSRKLNLTNSTRKLIH